MRMPVTENNNGACFVIKCSKLLIPADIKQKVLAPTA